MSGSAVTVGICGLGTVGGGTLRVLTRNAEEITRRVGREIRVLQLAARTPRTSAQTHGIAFTHDSFAIARNPEIQVLVELIGGIDAAYALVMEAIAHGKHVVTANKALIAERGNELFEAARAKGVTIAFEASVAGGIPVVKAIREGLAGNRIERIAGIINGTSNFILTAMDQKGADFASTLAEAQRLGYAEADPSFDVGGIDAAHKLTILSSIAFGAPLRFDAVYIEGIATICAEDIEYARQLGYRIKHLGITRRRADGIELRVHPTLVPLDHLLANVSGVMNAVLVHSDAAGASLYYGRGAGAEPTASAVVADIVDVARMIAAPAGACVPPLAFQADAVLSLPIVPIADTEAAYYLRIPALDRPGVLAQIARILSEEGISIESVIQKEQAIRSEAGESWVPVIILTQRVREKNVDAAIAGIQQLEDIPGPITRIRVESLR